MDLRRYVDDIHNQLAIAAEPGGDDAVALAERLVTPLDAALRLAFQEVLTAAAEEITTELAPGSVEVRLRGRELELVVTPPPAERAGVEPGAQDGPEIIPRPAAGGSRLGAVEGDDGGMARINLRLPDQLKARVEQAAGAEGVSVNSWLVRAAGAALEQPERNRERGRRSPPGAQRYSGWAR